MSTIQLRKLPPLFTGSVKFQVTARVTSRRTQLVCWIHPVKLYISKVTFF